MNKLFIVFLAFCLISVHAHVKRDAPAADKNYLEDFQKQVKAFADDVNAKLKDAVDPDTLKKNFNDFVDNTKKLLDNANGKKE